MCVCVCVRARAYAYYRHIGLWPVVQHLAHLAAVLERQKHAPRALPNIPKLLASKTDGGCIDYGHVELDVVDQQAVEDTLVGVQERNQHLVFMEGVLVGFKQVLCSLDLLLQRFHRRGQQSLFGPNGMRRVLLCQCARLSVTCTFGEESYACKSTQEHEDKQSY